MDVEQRAKPTLAPCPAAGPTRKKILIIDDDPQIRASLTELFDCYGWVSRCAGDGEEGMRILLREEFRPELIVLDYQMPTENGICFWNELNDHPDLCYIPTLLLTAVPDLPLNMVGIRKVLHKTADVTELVESIAALLDQRLT